MKQCPKCGRYMHWYMNTVNRVGWKCVCGYDTGSITYTTTTNTEVTSEPYATDRTDMRGGE